MKSNNEMYDDSYFKDRQYNDAKRVESFIQEKSFLSKYLNLGGLICDVGCSTGEFLSIINLF